MPVAARLVEAVAPARLGRPFRWLVASSWSSNLGDGIGVAAGPLLVAAQTRSPSVVALAVVLQRLPWLVLGLLAGVVADRVDRRRLALGLHLSRAALLLALAAAVGADRAGVAVVLVAVVLLGVAEVFLDTTTATLTPMVVAPADLGVANARVMAGFVTVNQLVGPPLGAALFAASPVAALVAEGATAVVAAACAARLRLPPLAAPAAPPHVVRDIAEGLRWLWGNPPVRTLALTIVTFNVTYGAAWSVLVLYAVERLRAGEVGYGLLTTAIAVGGLAGTATYGRLTARLSLGVLMRAGLVIETLTHLALALTTTLWVALAVLVVFGAHAFVWGTTSTSVRQRAVPAELQGRVTSAYLLGVQGGIVVGSALGAVIAGAAGVVAPFWAAFAGSAVLVVLLWRSLLQIAHADEAAVAAAG